MAGLSNVEALIRNWRRDGVRLLPPRDEGEVRETLGRAGRPVARDLVALYRATGGMEDGEMDGECLTLWTPERVAEENSAHARTPLLFMDFLINSHAYGAQYEDEETSSVYIDHYGAAPARRVAESLDDFLRLCLTDPQKIFV